MPGRDRSWRTWRSSSTSRGRRPRSRSARRARPARGGPRRTPRGWPWPPSLLLQRGELVDDRACRRVRLEVVVPRGLADAEDLADHAEVVERTVGLAELRPRHRRLPHLAFLGLAVAEDAVDARAGGAELEAERQSERDRQALAERARRCLDPGQGTPVRMTLERRAELAERDELRLGEEARPRHDRVERGDGVALGEDDTVPVGPVGALGVVAQPAEVERRENVDHREGSARVSRARVGEHADYLHPAVAGDRFETRVSHQSSSSMNAAVCSTRTPRTAISGAYTTSSAAQTIVPRTSLVMPTMLLRIFPMFSLIRIAFALSGAASRPSRMI